MSDKRKELDDTDLAWYGLTEKEIEKMKEEKDEIGDVDIDTLYLASKMQEFLYMSGKEVSLDDILIFLKTNVKNNEEIGSYSII